MIPVSQRRPQILLTNHCRHTASNHILVRAEKVIGILRFWPGRLVGSRKHHNCRNCVAAFGGRSDTLTRAGWRAHAHNEQRHVSMSHSRDQTGLADQCDRQGKAERARVGKGFLPSRHLYGQPWKFPLGLGPKSRALQLSAPTNYERCCDWLQIDGPNLRKLTSDCQTAAEQIILLVAGIVMRCHCHVAFTHRAEAIESDIVNAIATDK
jgi:hypothetical protein